VVRELSVKLSDDLYEQLEKLVEKTGKSKADIIRDALLMYLGIGVVSDKAISDTKSYVAPAIYSGKCTKCGKEIRAGDPAGFIKIIYEDKTRKVLLYCLDCYYSISDRTIAQLEVKKAKLEHVIRALNREKSRLVKEIEELEKLTETTSKIKTVIADLELYSNQVFQGDNEALKKLLFELRELNDLLAEFLRITKPKSEIYARSGQRSKPLGK
jgi:metal-responsive CopG/Arc/MetJ family transcriptional regulator